MPDEEERLWAIAADARELRAFILGETSDEIPSKFQPDDSALKHRDEQMEKLSDLLKMSMQVSSLRGQEIKKNHEILDQYVDQLESLSLKPEVSDDQLSFSLDGLVYRIAIERKYMVYLYWGDQHLSNQEMMFVGTSADFSCILRLIEKLISWLPPEKISPFQEFEEKVKKIADQFRPGWRELHGKAVKKNRDSSRLFLSQRDADSVMEEFKTSLYGPELSGLLQTGDIEKILVYCADLAGRFSLEKGGISEGMWERIESELSILFPQESSGTVFSKEFVEGMTKILGKYTVSQKINSLQADLRSIQENIKQKEAAKAQSISKTVLIQEAVERASLEDFSELVYEIQESERKKINDYFEIKSDAFFLERTEFFLSILLDNIWLFEEKMLRRLIPLIFSDPGLLRQLGIDQPFDESFQQAVESDMKDIKDFPELTKNPKESYSRVVALMGEEIYSAHDEEIKKLIAETSNEEFPEKFSQRVVPWIVGELQKGTWNFEEDPE